MLQGLEFLFTYFLWILFDLFSPTVGIYIFKNVNTQALNYWEYFDFFRFVADLPLKGVCPEIYVASLFFGYLNFKFIQLVCILTVDPLVGMFCEVYGKVLQKVCYVGELSPFWRFFTLRLIDLITFFKYFNYDLFGLYSDRLDSISGATRLLIWVFRTIFSILCIPFIIFNALLKLGGFTLLTLMHGFSLFYFCCLLFCSNIFFLFSSSYTMLPEFVLVLSIIVAVLFYGLASVKYDLGFFHKQIALTFGYDALVRVSNFGTFERNMLLRFHNSRRQLTMILILWRVLFVGSLFSFLWFMAQFGFFYPVTLHSLDYSSLSFTTISSNVVGVSDAVFGAHFYHDGFTFTSRFFLLFLFILFLIIVRNELFQESKLCNLEFLILYTFGVLFSMLLVSSFSLFSFFLSAEGLVITMYLLAASGIYYRLFSKFHLTVLHNMIRYRSLEGALKYSIFNILSTFFLLFGSVLLFAATRGSLFFSNISLMITSLQSMQLNFSLLLFGSFVGVLCLCFAFFFKLGIFPFSSWVPDLYESTIPINMVYFLVLPKAAIMLAFVNFYRFFFVHFYSGFFIICATLGLASIIYGSLGAINQKKISRILAYSSITYAGLFIFLTAICFLPSVRLPHLAIVFAVAYVVVLLFFLVFYLTLRYSPYYFTYVYVSQFRFAQTKSKAFQLFLVNSLFSLSGIPPFFGWILKFVFLIALVKLFSFGIFNLFKTSYWVPADLLINFFQQYDTRWIVDGTYEVQKTLFDQLSIKLSKPVYLSFKDRILDPTFYMSISGSVLLTSSIPYCYSYSKNFLYDCVDVAFIMLQTLKNGIINLIFGTKVQFASVASKSLVSEFSDLILKNKVDLVLSILNNSSWFLVTGIFVLFFLLFLVTVLSTFYYLRILKSVYTSPKHAFLYYNQNTGAINISFSMCALTLFLAVANVFGILFFQFVNNTVFFLFCLNSVGF